ncbi:MAG: hypothetical protein H6660_07100 [Ardenticatenaceae bacterium]|nr:hypothetical protein [Ardenticatenaceae bacterium]
MKTEKWGFVAVILAIVVPLATAVAAQMSPPLTLNQDPPTVPIGRTATDEELAQAQAEWEQSAHAATYDDGMGANTTCARCKSPANWDPMQDAAAQEALDCGSCKRVPGAPRPELASGVPVSEAAWQHITCDICHVPVEDSYSTSVAFWNQALGQYEPVETVMDLCAHCHEGQHGFEVVEEQEASVIHAGWECTRCHGAHGAPAACTDCHDPDSGAGAPEHDRHPSVNCTACHDNGRLSIWQDPIPSALHYGEYITRRFAHTLTSWPSHNLTTEINCVRCHHPLEPQSSSVVPTVSCEACHEQGAALFWCEYFQRNPDPNAETAVSPTTP